MQVRLEALKARVERQMPDRVCRCEAQWDATHQHVTALEAWGSQVLEDLWRDLAAVTRQFVSCPAAT